MKQSEINRAVANSLGESVATIDRLGFSLQSDACEERDPLVVDFDDLSNPASFPSFDPTS